jgi:hypothetical protein
MEYGRSNGRPIAIVLYKNETGTPSTDSGRAMQQSIDLSFSQVRICEPKSVETQQARFHVFDGGSRILIEAQSEEDARYLCTEMDWELICACEG